LTTTAVLIPVKSSAAKSRLSQVLSGLERREFAELLLRGVLEALGQAGLLSSSYVVSSDSRTLTLARRMGADVILEPGNAGVNSAVSRGIRRTRPSENVLVIPSDLPLLQASELRHLIALKSAGLDVVMAPSWSFDGTNALLFSRERGITLSYDDDSFWNHLESCAQRGLSVGVSSRRGLTFDVDSPEDLRSLARLGPNKPLVPFAVRATR
jgi:2-phospho-L-lactate guanylyltransferase